MSDLQVDIVSVPPMRVASVRVVSETPERDAWEKMRAWAESKRLLTQPGANPVFGFNNPPPAEGRKEYGYEFWIRVDPNTEVAGELEAKDFPGGLYAVTRCRLYGDPKGNVLEIWKRLWDWVVSSDYEWRRTHELEKPVDPLAPEEELVLDLYLPIEG
ncbi:MAG: GyrI-like domain-containing protein [Gemmatimonadota bacterium]|nr:MAG: GyrI-like domain-containing protein [Gemmatimonadota bacterium]